jgi:predicted transcriptional regulator of viral defense system
MNYIALNRHMCQYIAMKWGELLHLIGGEPVFSSALLLAGPVRPADVRQQLSRWVTTGRLVQLRRGLYAVADPYRKANPHPFLLSNRLKDASYVSLQSALAHYGLIPEAVPVVTAVTTGRPETVRTAFGSFLFRHLHPHLFWGYRQTEFDRNQAAFVARPEKALLDLIHLTPGADDPAYLGELRLQHLDRLDWVVLEAMAKESGKAKLQRAVQRLMVLRDQEMGEAL